MYCLHESKRCREWFSLRECANDKQRTVLHNSEKGRNMSGSVGINSLYILTPHKSNEKVNNDKNII